MSEDRISIAKSIPLTDLVVYAGYTPVKRGHNYILKEHDSFVIFPNTNSYCHYSRLGSAEHSTGSTIDFCEGYMNMSAKEAIEYLLELAGYDNNQTIVQWKESKKDNVPEQPKKLVLPQANADNRRVIAYLTKTRGISISVLNPFLRRGRLYESADYHNCVFVTYDEDKIPRYASQRSTQPTSSFKADVAGSDKSYGFPSYNAGSNKVTVFEAPIDMLSYMYLYPEDKSSKIALGCLSPRALHRFLKMHEHVDMVSFMLDNDEPAIEAASKMKEELASQGYKVEDNPLGELLRSMQVKDVNEYLKAVAGDNKTNERSTFNFPHTPGRSR